MLMIMKYINMDWEDHITNVKTDIEANKLYKNASDKFYQCIKSVEKGLELEIESEVSLMETMAIDIAYDKGFQEGVKFIMACTQGNKLYEGARANV